MHIPTTVSWLLDLINDYHAAPVNLPLGTIRLRMARCGAVHVNLSKGGTLDIGQAYLLQASEEILEQLEVRLAAVKGDTAQLQSEIDKAKQHTSGLQQSCDDLTQQLQVVAADNSSAEEALAAQTESNTIQLAEVEDLQNQTDILQASMLETQPQAGQLEAIQTSVAEQQQQVQTLQRKAKEDAARLDDLQRENEDLVEKLSASAKNMDRNLTLEEQLLEREQQVAALVRNQVLSYPVMHVAFLTR